MNVTRAVDGLQTSVDAARWNTDEAPLIIEQLTGIPEAEQIQLHDTENQTVFIYDRRLLVSVSSGEMDQDLADVRDEKLPACLLNQRRALHLAVNNLETHIRMLEEECNLIQKQIDYQNQYSITFELDYRYYRQLRINDDDGFQMGFAEFNDSTKLLDDCQRCIRQKDLINQQLQQFLREKLEPLKFNDLVQTDLPTTLDYTNVAEMRVEHRSAKRRLVSTLKEISKMQSAIVTFFYTVNNLSADLEEQEVLFRQSVLLIHRSPSALAAALIESARRQRFQPKLDESLAGFRNSFQTTINQEQRRRLTFHREISPFLPCNLYEEMFSLEPPRLEIKFMDYAVKRFKQNHLAAIDDMQRQTKAFMEHQIPAAAAIDLRRTSAAKVLATIQAMMPQLTNNFISAFLTADYNSEDLIKVYQQRITQLEETIRQTYQEMHNDQRSKQLEIENARLSADNELLLNELRQQAMVRPEQSVKTQSAPIRESREEKRKLESSEKNLLTEMQGDAGKVDFPRFPEASVKQDNIPVAKLISLNGPFSPGDIIAVCRPENSDTEWKIASQKLAAHEQNHFSIKLLNTSTNMYKLEADKALLVSVVSIDSNSREIICEPAKAASQAKSALSKAILRHREFETTDTVSPALIDSTVEMIISPFMHRNRSSAPKGKWRPAFMIPSRSTTTATAAPPSSTSLPAAESPVVSFEEPHAILSQSRRQSSAESLHRLRSGSGNSSNKEGLNRSGTRILQSPKNWFS